MLRLRFSISQFIAITAAACSLFALLAEMGQESTVWKTRTLQYSVPDIPVEYADNGRPSPYFIIGKWLDYQYSNGRELFLAQHRRGWRHCRQYFFDKYPENIGPPTVNVDQFDLIDNSKWTNEHWGYPYYVGYDDCEKQLANLLESNTATKLRSKIGYSRYWHYGSYLAILIVSMFFAIRLRANTNRRITSE